MNLDNYMNYIRVGTASSSTNTPEPLAYTLVDTDIYTRGDWLVGGGGSSSRTATIQTNSVPIDRDLWESLTSNAVSSSEPVHTYRGRRADYVAVDDYVWEWLEDPISRLVKEIDESEPCDAIPDDELAKLL